MTTILTLKRFCADERSNVRSAKRTLICGRSCGDAQLIDALISSLACVVLFMFINNVITRSMGRLDLRVSCLVFFVALSLRTVECSSVLLQNATLKSNRETLATTSVDQHIESSWKAINAAATAALQVRIG
jgi:hypothetical protein